MDWTCYLIVAPTVARALRRQSNVTGETLENGQGVIPKWPLQAMKDTQQVPQAV